MVSMRSEGEKRRKIEENKKRATSERLKRLVMDVRYARTMNSMLHVNAMRMDAKREHKTEKHKNASQEKTFKRHHARAWCCMILCYMLVSSLCLRTSETASYEKRESKNDKKAE
jgi:hypothetical protein